jgi:phosphatidylglycerophosphate synthase
MAYILTGILYIMNSALEAIRNIVRRLMASLAKQLNTVTRGKVSPNTITTTSLIAHIGIAYLIAQENFLWAALLLVIFGLFDALDGSLARLQNTSSTFGMLFDSITDKIKEVMLYGGIVYALIVGNQPFWAVWAVLACGFSIVVSYVNAWGEVVAKHTKSAKHAANKTFRTGIMTYDVRMATLIIGLVSGYIAYAVVIIATLSLVTIAERFYLITKKL